MRNGFTLIELLAVIVILAIIALIAVPIVLNVIKDSKKSAFKLSINNIVSALDLYEKNLKMEGISVNKIELSCDGISCNITKLLNRYNSEIEIENDKLNVTGKIFNGSIILSSVEGNLKYDYALNDGEYCAHKYSQDKEMEITNYREGYCEINIPTDSSCFTISEFSPTAVEISGYDSSCPKDVVIPKMIEGKEVITIKLRAFDSKNIESVIIPDSVKTIEQLAFYSNKLTNIVIPSSVTTIEQGAFYRNKLTNVIIPDSVKIIQNNAFRENLLTNIEIPNSVTEIGTQAFNKNKLPDEQAYIYARTDANNDGIAEIDYTKIISYGGESMNIIIPNSVKVVGEYAFSEENLTNVVIPEGVETIETHAFERVNDFDIIIPSTVTTIGYNAFAYSSIRNMTINGDSSRFCERWTHYGFKTSFSAYSNYCSS